MYWIYFLSRQKPDAGGTPAAPSSAGSAHVLNATAVIAPKTRATCMFRKS